MRCAVFVVSVLTLCGCGGKGKDGATATVSGKVTLASGAPLPGGIITFQSAATPDKKTTAMIKGDGSYEASGVPQGECKVAIDNILLKAGAAGLSGGTNMPAGTNMPETDTGTKFVQINTKYAKPETSGLTTTVSGDKHTYNVDLK